MNDRFRGIYRNESARAWWRDYSSDGLYYITACTYGMECTLGKIISKKMFPSSIGEIVLEEWYKSFEIRRELSCDIFQMMPNHLHAILRIDTDGSGAPKGSRLTETVTSILHSDVTRRVQTFVPSALPKSGVAYRPPRSISSFVGGFKSAATKKINEYKNTPRSPVWQPRFHDHVIRSFEEYCAIYMYIRNNVRNWKADEYWR
jgi:REP element-mobilizing transposase RayT